MRGSIGDKQRLIHIQEAISEIREYTRNADLSDFKNNSMMRFACIKQIEIIGEAARNITEETTKNYPGIPWRQIAGLRNILVHEYFGVDNDLIWQIIKTDIPELEAQLQESS